MLSSSLGRGREAAEGFRIVVVLAEGFLIEWEKIMNPEKRLQVPACRAPTEPLNKSKEPDSLERNLYNSGILHRFL